MPPRKKARLTPTPSAATPTATTPQADAQTSPTSAPFDPWTSEQETALFKAIIRHKPTGMHKHFHMLSIASYLRTHGHTTKHTRMPAIWEKLGGLYDLEALDEREVEHSWDVVAQGEEEDKMDEDEKEEKDEDDNEEWTREFRLPGEGEDDDFTQLMWSRRLKSHEDPASSPPEMPWLLERQSHGSPMPSKRGGAATRGTRLKPDTSQSSRKSAPGRATRESKQGSVASTDQVEEDEDEEDEEDGDEEESQADSNAADSAQGRDTRATRSAKGVRGGRNAKKK